MIKRFDIYIKENIDADPYGEEVWDSSVEHDLSGYNIKEKLEKLEKIFFLYRTRYYEGEINLHYKKMIIEQSGKKNKDFENGTTLLNSICNIYIKNNCIVFRTIKIENDGEYNEELFDIECFIDDNYLITAEKQDFDSGAVEKIEIKL